MMSGCRVRRTVAASSFSLLLAGFAAGCAGKVNSTSLGSSPPPASDRTPIHTAPSHSPAVRTRPSTPPAHPVSVSVFYVDAEGNLVARKVQVDAHADTIEEALTIAGTSPREAALSNAYPADAFVSASYDGFGSHGEFGVVLRDRSVEGSQVGMTSLGARMAIRAAVCTAQNGTDSPVMFYLHRKSASGLFGEPLTEGKVSDAHCPH